MRVARASRDRRRNRIGARGSVGPHVHQDVPCVRKPVSRIARPETSVNNADSAGADAQGLCNSGWERDQEPRASQGWAPSLRRTVMYGTENSFHVGLALNADPFA